MKHYTKNNKQSLEQLEKQKIGSRCGEDKTGLHSLAIPFQYLRIKHKEKCKKNYNYDTFDAFNIAGNPISDLVCADKTVLITNCHRGLDQLIQTLKKLGLMETKKLIFVNETSLSKDLLAKFNQVPSSQWQLTAMDRQLPLSLALVVHWQNAVSPFIDIIFTFVFLLIS